MPRRSYAGRRIWALVLLLAAATPVLAAKSARRTAPASTAAPVTASGMKLVLEPTKFEADDQLQWSVRLTVENQSDAGLYLDSAKCEVENLDLGVTGGPKKSWALMPSIKALIESISAGEFGVAQYQFPATSENARLTIHVYAHNSVGKPFVASATGEATPGALSRRIPARTLQVGGHKVEIALVSAAGDSGLRPAVLIVHGSGSHARSLLGAADKIAASGMSVMLVSQPGFGTSEGPADWMGPATLSALSAALDELKKSPGVDPNRIGIWGQDRGATAALLLAARRPDVRAVVAQSGFYDLWATYRGTVPELKETIEREAGHDSAAWQARSPASGPSKLTARVLVIHGEADLQAPVAQAHAYEAALFAGGTNVESRYLPHGAHQLPSGFIQNVAMEFLKKTLAQQP